MAHYSPTRAIRVLSQFIVIICIMHLMILFGIWSNNIIELTHFVTFHLSFLLLCLLMISYRTKQIQQAWSEDQQARRMKQQLLETMLPNSIAQNTHPSRSLKMIDEIPCATILFADIVDFSQLSRNISPQELVQFLDKVYTAFDHITQQHGLEKIKTIGDEYMAVSGAPDAHRHDPKAVCRCALIMQHQFRLICRSQNIQSNLRIGIHSGRISAGIIGTSKPSYDVWGDTVNFASRLQSCGKSGKVQLSHTSYKLVNDAFLFENAKQRNIKGQGLKRTHFLIGIKSHA